MAVTDPRIFLRGQLQMKRDLGALLAATVMSHI